MTADKRRGWMFLAGGVLGLLVLIIVAGRQLSVDYTSHLNACLDDSSTGGGMGLARWAKRLGVKVQSLDEPLWESLKKLSPPTGNLVVSAGDGPWSPWREQMEDEEWASVRGWVRRGNTLLVMTTDPNNLPEPFRHDFLSKPVKIISKQTRLPFRFLQPRVEAEPKTANVPLLADRRLLVQSGGNRLEDTPEEWEVASDGSGSVLHRIPVGEGAIYLLLDGYAWTNAGLDSDDNTRTMAALLRRELHGGVLGFDEYRHGHGRVESFWTFLAGVPGAKTFMWIGAILSGLYLYGRNVRFGPPEPHELPERRTAREYIEAVAYLGQRARAASLAVEAVLRRFRQLAALRGHITPTAEQVLIQADQYVAGAPRPIEPYDACELVTALIQLRKQLYGS